MKELTFTDYIHMYSKGWLPIAGGFKSTKNIVNDEISEAKKNLEYAINRLNNADANMISSCIEEINVCTEELDKLIRKAKNDPLAGINC